MKALRVAGCVFKVDEQGITIAGKGYSCIALPQSSRKLTSRQAWRIAEWFEELGCDLGVKEEKARES